MSFFKPFILAAVLAFGALSGAQAATINWATSVIDWQPGTGANPNTQPSRDNTANALGAADGDFFSIGQGGIALFGFDTLFGDEAQLVEVTNTTRSTYIEKLEIYVGRVADYTLGSFDLSVFTLVGTITNAAATSVVSLPFGSFDVLAIKDVSAVVAGRDGWDVDAIGVTPVPLPAGGLLLVGALGGLAALRRRRKVV